MKIIILLVFLAMSQAAIAQRYLVQFYPDNQPFPGLTNYPSGLELAADTNVTSGWATNMSKVEYDAHKLSLMPVYLAGESNAAAVLQASIDADIAELVVAYSNLQWCADHWSYVTNIANIRVAVAACGDTLLKLKPVLVEWYKGSQR